MERRKWVYPEVDGRAVADQDQTCLLGRLADHLRFKCSQGTELFVAFLSKSLLSHLVEDGLGGREQPCTKAGTRLRLRLTSLCLLHPAVEVVNRRGNPGGSLV